MLTVSEENTVKCLEGSLDIFFVRHFRLSLLNNFYCDILHLYNVVIAT